MTAGFPLIFSGFLFSPFHLSLLSHTTHDMHQYYYFSFQGHVGESFTHVMWLMSLGART